MTSFHWSIEVSWRTEQHFIDWTIHLHWLCDRYQTCPKWSLVTNLSWMSPCLNWLISGGRKERICFPMSEEFPKPSRNIDEHGFLSRKCFFLFILQQLNDCYLWGKFIEAIEIRIKWRRQIYLHFCWWMRNPMMWRISKQRLLLKSRLNNEIETDMVFFHTEYLLNRGVNRRWQKIVFSKKHSTEVYRCWIKQKCVRNEPYSRQLVTPKEMKL